MELTIVVADGADDAGAALARDYWDTNEVTDATVTYALKVSEVGARNGVAANVVSARVARLATASHPAARCSRCQGPLTFTSRTNLADHLAPPRWGYRQTGPQAICTTCTAIAREERLAQEHRLMERDRRRSEVAQAWLDGDRLDGTVAERVAALTPSTLVTAVALSRATTEHDGTLAAGWIDGPTLRALDSHRIATIVNPAEVAVWDSDDVDVDPTFERWSPWKSRLRLTPGIDGALDQRLAADRARFAGDPGLRALAHSALLGEMIALVDHHIVGCNLPELNETQADRMREVFEAHPSVPLAKVISAAWMSSRDGAAAVQTNRGMPPWKATTHVINKMDTRLNAPERLPAYNIPGRYVPGAMLLVLLTEVLGLRLIETSLSDVDASDRGDDAVSDELPTFDEIQARTLRLLSDAADGLRSDWAGRPDSAAEDEAAREALELIAAATAALGRVGQ